MIKLRHIGRRGIITAATLGLLMAGGASAALASTSGGQPTGQPPTGYPTTTAHCEYVMLTGQTTDTDHSFIYPDQVPWGPRQGAELVTIKQWVQVCEDTRGHVTVTDVTDPSAQEWATEHGEGNQEPNPFASPTEQPTGPVTGSPSGH